MENLTEADVARHNAKFTGYDPVRHTLDGVPLDQLANNPIFAESKRSKHGNVRTVREGLVFDSGAEADYWFDVLKPREALGEIIELERQIEYPLFCPVFVKGETEFTIERACEVASYRCDFRWREVKTGELIVADKKATDRKSGKKLTTAEYRLKRRWLALQQGIEIVEV
jgi:hypothetical protein